MSPPVPGTTMRDAASRRISRASSMACSMATFTASGNLAQASSIDAASSSNGSGNTPAGVSSWVWPEYSTALMKKLQDLQKPFDLMTYPGGKHGVIKQSGPGLHAHADIVRFFDRELKGQRP